MNKNKSTSVAVLPIVTVWIVEDDFGQVGQDHVDQSLRSRRALLHRGTGINLNEPNPQILINHEVVPEELEAVLAVVDLVLNCHQGCFDVFLDLWPYLVLVGILAELIIEVVGEFLTAPHVAFDLIVLELGKLLLHRVVGQMILSGVCLRIILLYAKTNVAFVVAPYCERVPISNKYPLPNIKLPPLNNERILYAFLNDPQTSVTFQNVYSVNHSFIRLVDFDSSAAGAASWL